MHWSDGIFMVDNNIGQILRDTMRLPTYVGDVGLWGLAQVANSWVGLGEIPGFSL